MDVLVGEALAGILIHHNGLGYPRPFLGETALSVNNSSYHGTVDRKLNDPSSACPSVSLIPMLKGSSSVMEG